MTQSTSGFRRQHTEILEIIGQMSSMLAIDDLRNDGIPIRTLLSRLGGVLLVHLSMEDRTLYPRLRESANQTFVAIAARYSDEMGGYKERYVAYAQRWLNPHKIQENPSDFIAETREILETFRD